MNESEKPRETVARIAFASSWEDREKSARELVEALADCAHCALAVANAGSSATHVKAVVELLPEGGDLIEVEKRFNHLLSILKTVDPLHAIAGVKELAKLRRIARLFASNGHGFGPLVVKHVRAYAERAHDRLNESVSVPAH